MNSPFTKLGKVLSHKLTRDRVCESCGQEFSCGASLRGCWCSEISLSDETRAELRSTYQDCLCRGCLEAAASAMPKRSVETEDVG